MAYDRVVVPEKMDFEITQELEREVRFFLRWGYLIVENAITEDRLESLMAALDELFARNQQSFTHQLLEEDDRFTFLLDNPPVMTRMKAILGNCIQLHSATARVTVPGELDQPWHRDHPWPIDQHGTQYTKSFGQINCGYYLDELTNENGPIVVVPGSHLAPFKPPKGFPEFPDEIRILAKPGQAVIFDGSLFHRGAANTSTGNRRVCLMCYQHAWIKSRETFNGPKMTKLREQGSNETRLLLGEIQSW